MYSSILLFPIAAILITAFSIGFPGVLSGYAGAIVPLLGIVMFAMGMTLSIRDFRLVFRQPGLVISGLCLQYILMPFIAWLIASLFSLPLPVTLGLILIGSCPGGTASNVICYLARGNVALSITLTSISTCLAVLMTPLLTYIYVDKSIDVPVVMMMKSLLLIILLPVTLGILINHVFHTRLKPVKPFLPVLSMLCVILIIGVIVARNQAYIPQLSLLVALAVVMHNVMGLLSGYWFARLLTKDIQSAKTIAIEVGMQNSGLGIVLANQYFSAAAALPGVLFSIWHNISGAMLAGHWSKKGAKREGA